MTTMQNKRIDIGLMGNLNTLYTGIIFDGMNWQLNATSYFGTKAHLLQTVFSKIIIEIMIRKRNYIRLKVRDVITHSCNKFNKSLDISPLKFELK